MSTEAPVILAQLVRAIALFVVFRFGKSDREFEIAQIRESMAREDAYELLSSVLAERKSCKCSRVFSSGEMECVREQQRVPQVAIGDIAADLVDQFLWELLHGRVLLAGRSERDTCKGSE